jgi:general secretion pathway protein G
MKTRRNERVRAGFTLAELMVVIVIIGLLATLVVPNVVRRLFAATRAKAEADISTISQSLEEYAVQNMGRYPETLEVLVTPDENGHTYLNRETVPTDPWGNAYVYEPPQGGRKANLISYGKDGVPGGDGDDGDITLEALRNK